MPSRRHARPWRPAGATTGGRRPDLAGERLRVTGSAHCAGQSSATGGYLEAGGGPDHKKAPRERPGRGGFERGKETRPGWGAGKGASDPTNAIGAGLFPTKRIGRRVAPKAVTSASRRSYNGENYPWRLASSLRNTRAVLGRGQ